MTHRLHLLRAATLAGAILTSLLAPSALSADGAEFQIFGHLTQAYGWSNVGNIRGTTEDGTTDLRNLAIQFRWERSEKETVIIQLSHERRGNDFLFPDEDEIEIDWAFYQRNIGPETELKVGRLNIPLGIYNEIRDVGTLLPFFDLPLSFYAGVLSSVETVDGVSLAHTFAARSAWDLETTVYFGGWRMFQQKVDLEERFLVRNLKARAENGLGVQLWLNTPVSGIRVGAGYLTWELEGVLSGPVSRDRWESWQASFDAVRERWMVRAELRQWTFDQDLGAFFGMPSFRAESQREGYYLQAGVWLTPELGLFGQYEDIALSDDTGLDQGLDNFYDDVALSLNYRFSPDLLLKAELHSSDALFPLGNGGPPPGAPGETPTQVEWGVVALSVSF